MQVVKGIIDISEFNQCVYIKLPVLLDKVDPSKWRELISHKLDLGELMHILNNCTQVVKGIIDTYRNLINVYIWSCPFYSIKVDPSQWRELIADAPMLGLISLIRIIWYITSRIKQWGFWVTLEKPLLRSWIMQPEGSLQQRVGKRLSFEES